MAFPFALIGRLLGPAKSITDAFGITGKGQKVDKIVEIVEEVLPPVVSQVDKQSAFDVIRQVLDEKTTDELIDKLVERIKPKLPPWLRWLPIKYALDAIFPEIVLDWLEDLLTR